MKTRSSSGVGQKVDLEFDLETLRIRDVEEDNEENRRPATSIYDQIKAKSITSEPASGQDSQKIVAEVGSNKLKSMLAGLKNNKSL